SEITIEFVDLIRKEIKFSSLDALKEQLKTDKASVIERLGKL
ncbi:MAG: bifunctional riboflavin kinase/FMN adenylyltransferase, partial [Cytophagia bacterium]|nr:bifunctional riboflavin kinase/FMN adenylyltransferase [Cytophagia bacterium]